MATVVDGFEETDQYARFDFEPTMLVSVFRTGDQSAVEIAELATQYVEEARARLPEGVTLTVWQNDAESLNNQLPLMLRSRVAGFALVFLVLALFLELRLAFWVSLGIPISFFGALALMPGVDVSINVLSLFGFVLVLGIVVDDAIIVGEHIFRHQEEHGDGMRGAIEGAYEIPEAVEVDFALSTLSAGSDVDVQLAGPDVDVLRTAAEEVKQHLRGYAGVYEVTDSFRAGKQEMKLGIKPSAETVGLTLESLGHQVCQALYGEEAQRIQRGRDDVRVMVRYPRDERRSLGDLENMRIRHPGRGPGALQPGRHRRARTRVRVDPARGPEPNGQRHRLDRPGRDVGRRRHRRPERAHPSRGSGALPGRVLLVRGGDGRAARRPRRAAARLHARAAADLRVAGGAVAVLRAAADHHERHPVRAHRCGLGPRLPGPERVDHVDVSGWSR